MAGLIRLWCSRFLSTNYSPIRNAEVMTIKERLHQLIEELPESDLATAERVLAALRNTSGNDDSQIWSLDNAPEEDPTPEEAAAILEAKVHIIGGERLIPHEEARRLLLEEP